MVTLQNIKLKRFDSNYLWT